MADEKKLTSEELTDEQANGAAGGDNVIYDPNEHSYKPNTPLTYDTSNEDSFPCWFCGKTKTGPRFQYGSFLMCENCKKHHDNPGTI